MPAGIQPSVAISTPPSGFLGLDTASEPTSIDIARSRRLYNAHQGKLRALTKRPGSAPVIDTSLSDPIKHLTMYPFGTPQLLASSGTSLFKYVGATLTSVTMTNPLNSADIYDGDFTGVSGGSAFFVKLIGDGGTLKQYDGTEVKEVVPAADDPLPAPANVLADINSLGIKYVWTFNGYVFMSPGDNQIFYSKQATMGGSGLQYNYVPETSNMPIYRNGDYINGVAVPFDGVQFVPMRRNWCLIEGTNFNDFVTNVFLNTIDGVIAPRSPQIITYATGVQTIAYLSDTGINEIVTTILDNRGKQYATKNLMTNKLDWGAYEFTDAEMAAAVGKYIVQFNMYLLEISRDGTPYVFGYDTRNGEFYIWTGLQINDLIENGGLVYFASDDGLLKKFDTALTDDWEDKDMTTGVPVDFDRISGMVWFEDTGYPSSLDYYILRLKQYAVAASLDISIIYMSGTVEIDRALQSAYAIWDTETSLWDGAMIANLDYTDLVSAPQRLSNRLLLPKKGFYFQVRWRNNRSEPVEIYSEKFIGRTSGEK